jgi:hypothetical protein
MKDSGIERTRLRGMRMINIPNSSSKNTDNNQPCSEVFYLELGMVVLSVTLHEVPAERKLLKHHTWIAPQVQ